jgi:hypothetical protein
VIPSLRSRRRRLAALAAVIAVIAVASAALVLMPGSGNADVPPSADLPSIAAFSPSEDATQSFIPIGITASPSATDAASPSASPTAAGTTFQPINMFATRPPATPTPAGQTAIPDTPGDPIFGHDNGRQTPSQLPGWLELKAYGRIALSKGQVGVLPDGAWPLNDPVTGKAVPEKRTLDLTWTRWIVEPLGKGTDQKGNRYVDLSYWNLCGPGSATVTLYYWQQLTGHPNVTGTAGYFLDPYVASGSRWPNPGPIFIGPNGKSQRIGTYWSGSDRVNGFRAHSRGFLMYIAMQVKPGGWTTPGIDIMVDAENRPRYPLLGAPPQDIETALNWEASNHSSGDWQDTYYTSVPQWDPNLARDLEVAVMLDVGRDGVPVVATVDTYHLPNWRAGSRTPHTRHAITIVGYDNTANPPNFTYLDTCGRNCNSRDSNRNGSIHIISQAAMVQALTDPRGQGFIW